MVFTAIVASAFKCVRHKDSKGALVGMDIQQVFTDAAGGGSVWYFPDTSFVPTIWSEFKDKKFRVTRLSVYTSVLSLPLKILTYFMPTGDATDLTRYVGIETMTANEVILLEQNGPIISSARSQARYTILYYFYLAGALAFAAGDVIIMDASFEVVQ